jgi:hypothetical protein
MSEARSGGSGFTKQLSPGAIVDSNVIQTAGHGLSLVQDIDLDPQAFAKMVKGGKMPAVVVIMTGGTYQSASQLARLGFQQQYNTAGFRPQPIAICDIFSMPDMKVVQDIQKGKVLALGANPRAAIKDFLTEDVSFARIALALVQVLEARVFLCNCPILTERQTKDAVLPSLVKVVESIERPAKAVPESGVEQNSEGDCKSAPAQKSRYMAKDIEEEAVPGDARQGSVIQEQFV